MDYKIKKLEKSEVEIKFTLTDEEIEKHMEQAGKEASKDLKIKGFRPGHIPFEVVKEHIGAKYLTAHAQELAIQRAYAEAVMKEQIQVIARPQVKVDSEKPFTFTATVATLPEIELKDYKSIKVPTKEAKAEKKDVEEVIADMVKHGTKYEDTDEASKKNDRIEVDFEGFDGDKPEAGTKSQSHPVIIGSNTMIPGFEEELIGLKKGDKKEFDITFPKDYHKKDFQKKKLTFKVEVKNVQKASEPELNEELIEKMTGQKKSVEDFKKELEKNILAKKEQQNKQERENKYIEELLKKVKVELPESLIDDEVNYIVEEMKQDIVQKGMDFDKFLEQTKTSIDDLKKKYRDEGEKRIKVRLALQDLIKQEKVEVSLDEAKAELEKVKSFYPEEQQKKIGEDFEKGELKNQIMNRLALRKLFAKVLPE